MLNGVATFFTRTLLALTIRRQRRRKKPCRNGQKGDESWRAMRSSFILVLVFNLVFNLVIISLVFILRGLRVIILSIGLVLILRYGKGN